MKRTLAFLFVFSTYVACLPSVYGQMGNPPPCTAVEQVNIAPDSTKQQLLRKFIEQCEKNYWREDKGIVLIREYYREGKLCWLLTPCIDDRYRDNPPSRFADFGGDIILIFDADVRGKLKPANSNKDALNQCLEQIIGDRVYTRPTIKGRWTSDVLPFSNRKLQEGRHRIYAGNPSGSLIIIFNPDGSYKGLSPV